MARFGCWGKFFCQKWHTAFTKIAHQLPGLSHDLARNIQTSITKHSLTTPANHNLQTIEKGND